jgi:hypothetical protein
MKETVRTVHANQTGGVQNAVILYLQWFSAVERLFHCPAQGGLFGMLRQL